MGGVVIREFDKNEEIRPIGLEVVCVRAKVVFDGLIGPFSLTIGLWVEGGGELKAGAEEGSGFFPPGCHDLSLEGLDDVSPETEWTTKVYKLGLQMTKCSL